MEESALAEFDVTTGSIVDAQCLAQLGGLHALEFVVQLGFDGHLDFVRQLGTVGGEELDAVVVIGIVGSADDDAGFGPEGAGQVGDGRGGHGAHQNGLETRGGQTRLQCGLQHVAGDAGILADQHLASTLLGEHLARSPAQFHHKIRGDRVFTHLAAYTVGAKILSCHCLFSFFIWI